ncbi:cyclin-dependent kinase-like 2 isoform X1 [Sinocyclocheilus anshuiensis]|uniref:cyclin-dependent kinase-like 2 isoform X1 n=1 Tax=Sinocyclocheilus anshuiensis TaxID=1608454 RepID=UPI0007B9BA10|nr:PREDICTED: cyclin-dependent kinase-like 2 isoform X1 [Sinocyclocheilus anshuiensis]XP_016340330.1 PREDICTED: cyclin-dependent kinase-like 2 isoform X1 [Sinocyclocheilus anshuiensis]
MNKYETLGCLGSGSYGTVLKCRHRDTGRSVAVKKLLEEDETVRKIVEREIRLLKQLRHENLVNLLEVWKRKRRWYLVFEFVDRTVLDELEQFPSGLDPLRVRKHLYQILRAVSFCHQHNIIHRDVKPENVLVSQLGVVKLCDFGFARTMAAASGEVYTDYVATRWYRAPELLVGDTRYGKAVDVWAVGCLFFEMLTGDPLFPGDSDIDQLHLVISCFGHLTPRHREVFYRNPVFMGVCLPEPAERNPLESRSLRLSGLVLDLAQRCLQMDPDKRSQCADLLLHPYFTRDRFHLRFQQELASKTHKDLKENSRGTKSSRREKEKLDMLRSTPDTVQDSNLRLSEFRPSDGEDSDITAKLRPDNTEPISEPVCQAGIPPISTDSPATHSLRSFDKMKKQMNVFPRPSQQNLSVHLNTQVPSEHSRSRYAAVPAGKKMAELRFPELRNTLLPELRADGRPRGNKEQKNNRIPSITAPDLQSDT